MKNLIIGGSINYGINQLKPWVLSAKEITTHNTDIVLICGNTSKETIEWLDKQGVFTVDLIQVPNIPIHVLRFLSIYDYLKDNWLNYNLVITTDVKDVYFQTDPFKWLDYHNIGVKDMHQIVAGSESMLYKDEPWGNQNLIQCYGEHIHNIFKNNEIYNVGTLGGSAEYIKDLVFNIFTNATNRPIPIVDQAVYNVLIQTQPYKDITLFAPQSAGWAVQAGTTVDPSKIDMFRPFLTESEPIFEEGVVKTSKGKPFCIVHQYDRVPEWKKFVMNKYNQEDPNEFFTYRTT
jgi:hypothetical protein